MTTEFGWFQTMPLKFVIERLARNSQVHEGFGDVAVQSFKRILKDAAFEACYAFGKPAPGSAGPAFMAFQAKGEALRKV